MRSIRLSSLLGLMLVAGCHLDGSYVGQYRGWEKDLKPYDLPPNLAAQHCFLIGAEFEKQTRWNEALQYFEQAKALDPLLPGLLPKLALLSEKVGDPEQAAKFHRAACQSSPFDAQLHREAGKFFARTDSLTEAQYHLQESARLEPNQREVWEELGKTLARQERPRDAMLAFLTIYPEEEARLRVGMVLFQSGRKAEGREIIDAAVNADPGLEKLARGLVRREMKKPAREVEAIQTVGFEEPSR